MGEFISVMAKAKAREGPEDALVSRRTWCPGQKPTVQRAAAGRGRAEPPSLWNSVSGGGGRNDKNQISPF